MKKIALALLMTLASLPLWAQSNAATGDADLEALHDAYRKRASEALETLEKRRGVR